MFKIYSKLFISLLLFVSFLNASSDKLNQQIFELKTSQEFAQKLNDEKITLIMGQIIQKENEIKELQNELEKYTKKEELEKDLNHQNERIEDINSHVDKLSVSITMFGIFITAVIIIFTGTFFYVSNKKHLEKIDEWIERNQDKILDPIRLEAKDLQDNIEKRALDIYQEKLKEFKIDEKLDESQKENQKEVLKKVNEILDKKEKEQYTYQDWFSKFQESYFKYDYKQALIYVNKRIVFATSDYEMISSLYQKAFLLSKKIETEESLVEALTIYNQINTQFLEISDLSSQVILSRSLLNGGFYESKVGNYNNALSYYSQLIKKFSESNVKEIKDNLSKCYINKLELDLLLNKKFTEDISLLKKRLNDDRDLVQIAMLEIFYKLQFKEQKDELNHWKEEFISYSLEDWDFNLLIKYAENFDGEIRQRMLDYVDILKNIKN